jgi:transcriptional regulator with GAF, ATPase, and Fis domain
LQSVLKQALLHARGAALLPADLPDLSPAAGGPAPLPPSGGEDSDLEAFVRRCLSCDEGNQYAEAHRRLDRVLLVRVLEAAGGDQYDAARRLGISPESLGCRLRELGVHPSRAPEGRDEREATGLTSGLTLADAEREHILGALRETGGVVGGPKGAAVRLGMKRSMLYWKMKQLGISRPK